MAKKNKYYAVAVGKIPGIYTQWFGNNGAEVQVRGVASAVFKGFADLSEAKAFLAAPPKKWHKTPSANKSTARDTPDQAAKTCQSRIDETGKIVIYTDGSALGNPGPGGYGVVIANGGKNRELSKGFRLTTNNRMELMACIEGLKAIKTASAIVLYSDSKYVINGITKGWAKKWRANNWMRTSKDPAINSDLWGILLDLCTKHTVTFCWVKGHAGIAGNERCDILATGAASGSDLAVDRPYEKGTQH
jgi:ribonuclease HI